MRRSRLALFALVIFLASFLVSYWLVNLGFGEDTLLDNPDSNYGLNFDPEFEKFIAEEEISEDAEEDEKQQGYLGIFGQHIAIFLGETEGGGILQEQTDITIDKIPKFEIDNLRRGIPFGSEEEKYSILEGLHFPR